MPRPLFALFYDYVEDIATRRTPFRAAHLELIEAYHGDGRLEIAGAYGDPVKGGLFGFASSEAASAFVAEDPYQANGLVVTYRIEPWTVVTP